MTPLRALILIMLGTLFAGAVDSAVSVASAKYTVVREGKCVYVIRTWCRDDLYCCARVRCNRGPWAQSCQDLIPLEPLQ
jgi:hypothetical protein